MDRQAEPELEAHIRVALRFEAVSARAPLSDLQWSLARAGRIFELAAWVADPTLLLAPERVSLQLERSSIPRLPVRYSSGIVDEADPRIVHIKPGTSGLAAYVPSTVAWALHQMLIRDEARGVTLTIADRLLWSLREMAEQPERVDKVMPETTYRLREIVQRLT